MDGRPPDRRETEADEKERTGEKVRQMRVQVSVQLLRLQAVLLLEGDIRLTHRRRRSGLMGAFALLFFCFMVYLALAVAVGVAGHIVGTHALQDELWRLITGAFHW